MAGEGSVPRKWKEQFFWNQKAAGNGGRGVCSLLQHLGLPAPCIFPCFCGGNVPREVTAPAQAAGHSWNLDPGVVEPCRSTRTSESWIKSLISVCAPSARSVGIRGKGCQQKEMLSWCCEKEGKVYSFSASRARSQKAGGEKSLIFWKVTIAY